MKFSAGSLVLLVLTSVNGCDCPDSVCQNHVDGKVICADPTCTSKGAYDPGYDCSNRGVGHYEVGVCHDNHCHFSGCWCESTDGSYIKKPGGCQNHVDGNVMCISPDCNSLGAYDAGYDCANRGTGHFQYGYCSEDVCQPYGGKMPYHVTIAPTSEPTKTPTTTPTGVPTISPTGVPTITPTTTPTGVPTISPTAVPTKTPTEVPTVQPCCEVLLPLVNAMDVRLQAVESAVGTIQAGLSTLLNSIPQYCHVHVIIPQHDPQYADVAGTYLYYQEASGNPVYYSPEQEMHLYWTTTTIGTGWVFHGSYDTTTIWPYGGAFRNGTAAIENAEELAGTWSVFKLNPQGQWYDEEIFFTCV